MSKGRIKAMNSVIETYENNAYTIEEFESELEKYQGLFDSGDSEAYEIVLYLEARLAAALEESQKDDKRIAELSKSIKALKKENAHLTENRLGKEDIMRMYNKESDWALRLLKYMYQNKMGIKLGRTYYTTKEQLEKFEKVYEGRHLFF